VGGAQEGEDGVEWAVMRSLPFRHEVTPVSFQRWRVAWFVWMVA
jgi:hypothetical protein